MFPRVCGNKTTLWLLVHIAVICLSAAVGAGTWCWNVGAEEVRYCSVGGPIFATTVFAISEGLFISLSYSPTSATTQPGNKVRVTHGASSTALTESTATTTGSPVCPSAYETTYTAAKKLVITFLAETEPTNSSFKFEIICNTNYFSGSITDLQIMSNVSP